MRKLCSTLVAYFLQFSMSWTRCIRHLVYCFCQDEAVPYQSVAGAPDTPILIENLSHDKALVIFWFAATLVDEVGKTDSSAMKQLSDFLAPLSSFTDMYQAQVSSASGTKCYRCCTFDSEVYFKRFPNFATGHQGTPGSHEMFSGSYLHISPT